RGGFSHTMGFVFTAASPERVVGELEAGPALWQPFGLVHGGVYCAMVETLASVGAAISAMPRGQSVVGLENATSFVRAHREGKLIGVATPLTRGRKTQVWRVEIRNEEGKLVAEGKVRVLCLEAGSEVAGKKVTAQRTEG
ncbi:MAG: PaaI family thioesterase, partial [Myxococcota bacterium]